MSFSQVPFTRLSEPGPTKGSGWGRLLVVVLASVAGFASGHLLQKTLGGAPGRLASAESVKGLKGVASLRGVLDRVSQSAREARLSLRAGRRLPAGSARGGAQTIGRLKRGLPAGAAEGEERLPFSKQPPDPFEKPLPADELSVREWERGFLNGRLLTLEDIEAKAEDRYEWRCRTYTPGSGDLRPPVTDLKVRYRFVPPGAEEDGAEVDEHARKTFLAPGSVIVDESYNPFDAPSKTFVVTGNQLTERPWRDAFVDMRRNVLLWRLMEGSGTYWLMRDHLRVATKGQYKGDLLAEVVIWPEKRKPSNYNFNDIIGSRPNSYHDHRSTLAYYLRCFRYL